MDYSQEKEHKMTTREDYNKMLDFYIETEKQFLDFIRIIPLDNNQNTYSPLLYNILQSSCGQVENLLRMICDKAGLQYTEKNFPSYHSQLNSKKMLEKQTVLLLKTKKKYNPFMIDQGFITPFWWRGYNDTKHDLPNGLKQGNLENTINALSSVYILHCVARYAHYSVHVIDDSLWYSTDPLYTVSGELVREHSMYPKSELFYSMRRFNSAGVPT